jgi:hypothetical protein
MACTISIRTTHPVSAGRSAADQGRRRVDEGRVCRVRQMSRICHVYRVGSSESAGSQYYNVADISPPPQKKKK